MIYNASICRGLRGVAVPVFVSIPSYYMRKRILSIIWENITPFLWFCFLPVRFSTDSNKGVTPPRFFTNIKG